MIKINFITIARACNYDIIYDSFLFLIYLKYFEKHFSFETLTFTIQNILEYFENHFSFETYTWLLYKILSKSVLDNDFSSNLKKVN